MIEGTVMEQGREWGDIDSVWGGGGGRRIRGGERERVKEETETERLRQVRERQIAVFVALSTT